jgi:Zn-finger nucleic acid-binding protein
MMRREIVPSAEIDVCDACGGLWVDWFDGQVLTLAVEAEAARVERGERTTGAGGMGAAMCPHCRHPLAAELGRFADATADELVTGVELLRCPECAGCFVPRSSAHLLLDRVSEPRAMTLWEAFVGLLRRVVGRRSS